MRSSSECADTHLHPGTASTLFPYLVAPRPGRHIGVRVTGPLAHQARLSIILRLDNATRTVFQIDRPYSCGTAKGSPFATFWLEVRALLQCISDFIRYSNDKAQPCLVPHLAC
jgi:hypothetical protein